MNAPTRPLPLSSLLNFIHQHFTEAVALPNGKILAREDFAAPAGLLEEQGHYGPYWTVIEPELSAVRDWLNY
ncbi:hypothetical protein [Paraburkholderia phytofirmans]|uniref:Uncharacterized protein n=1 Tax=Paraburkholderia phytofirmans (strain DSM 17436 / LMG 22146 / PsJN) TaxID=398527 RepID=B2TH50_PARPJ|nr:hypothetical protein [Paraburkholderia phytofirmans]ACD21599.1 hypothetical protein Bphyt_7314 [Paraburkholderia phytofirmans PsJN]